MTDTQTGPNRSVTTTAVLAIAVPALLLVVISSDMVTLVMPMIGSAFEVDKAQLAWVVTGYLIIFSIGIPFFGRISDRFSLHRLFVAALLTFAAGSAAGALAPGFVPLVVGRVIMGAGAAAIPVLSVVAIVRLLPADKRGLGFGLLGAAGGTGAALGPVFGGVVGQWLGWRGLLWVTAALAAILVPAALRVLPATAGEDRRPVDLIGGLLLGSSTALLLLGISQAQSVGFGSPTSWPLIIAAPVLAALFVWRIRAAAEPFVHPVLFTNRAFTASALTILLGMFVNLTALVFVPIMIIEENALTPGLAGLIMVPGGIALAVLSPIAGRLSARTGPRPLVLGGLIMIGAAMLFLAFVAGGSPDPDRRRRGRPRCRFRFRDHLRHHRRRGVPAVTPGRHRPRHLPGSAIPRRRRRSGAGRRIPRLPSGRWFPGRQSVLPVRCGRIFGSVSRAHRDHRADDHHRQPNGSIPRTMRRCGPIDEAQGSVGKARAKASTVRRSAPSSGSSRRRHRSSSSSSSAPTCFSSAGVSRSQTWPEWAASSHGSSAVARKALALSN